MLGKCYITRLASCHWRALALVPRVPLHAIGPLLSKCYSTHRAVRYWHLVALALVCICMPKGTN